MPLSFDKGIADVLYPPTPTEAQKQKVKSIIPLTKCSRFFNYYIDLKSKNFTTSLKVTYVVNLRC